MCRLVVPLLSCTPLVVEAQDHANNVIVISLYLGSSKPTHNVLITKIL